MTEAEAMARFYAIVDRGNGDNEMEHREADKLMIQCFRELGWESFAEAIEQTRKRWWYA